IQGEAAQKFSFSRGPVEFKVCRNEAEHRVGVRESFIEREGSRRRVASPRHRFVRSGYPENRGQAIGACKLGVGDSIARVPSDGAAEVRYGLLEAGFSQMIKSLQTLEKILIGCRVRRSPDLEFGGLAAGELDLQLLSHRGGHFRLDL